jgi:hypothetical protein
MRRPAHEDFSGLSPTHVQAKTVCVAPDELETLHEKAARHAAEKDIAAYLAAMGQSRDDATCFGDMLDRAPAAETPRPASSSQEPHTVHAYCEPLLPFLPVEDLAPAVDPSEPDDLPAPVAGDTAPIRIGKRNAPRAEPDASLTPSEKPLDPILEYLREVSAEISPTAEPTALARTPDRVRAVKTPLPALIPNRPSAFGELAAERTAPEQAAIHTMCVKRPGLASSGKVPTLRRGKPVWQVAVTAILIAALLLMSSAFTVEVLASKRIPVKAQSIPAEDVTPWVVPR